MIDPAVHASSRPSTARAGPCNRVQAALAGWRRMLAAFGCCLLAGAAGADVVHVDGRADVPLWPGVTVLIGADEALTDDEALAQPERFVRPEGTASNLGRTRGTVWVRATLDVAGLSEVQRVLEVNYPSLHHIDLYVYSDGQMTHSAPMGSALPLSDRPLQSRTHAAPLRLAPGTHELLMRVQTQTSVVLPLTLRSPESYMEHEVRMHTLLGLMGGLLLCMLLYSLMHWASLRDTVFLDYAVLLAANLVFMLSYFGIGALYLWPDWPGLSMQVAPMAVMVAIASGARFTGATLAGQPVSRLGLLTLKALVVLALASLLATLLGVLDYRQAQSAVSVLGVATTATVLPLLWQRVRQGDRAARYMLAGWAAYTVGALTTAALLRGWVEPTVLVQHLYPLSLMLEMAAWMAVLSLRVQDIHRNADRARVETENQRLLAHTDVLTGLPNRRGLQQHLATAVARATPQQLLALYLLDLDGFKPVNDRFGHDVGDALLVQTGHRLQAQLRGSDIVARLGGDEFVVLASGLADEATAQAIGHKLVAAFDLPFDIGGQQCKVGLTVGYALTPLDSGNADDLLKRADAAMYAGKQAGRHRVQRGGRSLAMAV